jgi:site-specific DNA-cytosine methylase
MDNPNNSLFEEFLRFVNEIQPDWFLFENVEGFVHFEEGKILHLVEQRFKDMGYQVFPKVLWASDYGVPQKRERVIIMGFLSQDDYQNFRYPSRVKKEERKVLGDVIMPEENINESLFFSEKAVEGMLAVREKMNKGRVQSLEEACNTISAHLAKVSLNSTDPVLLVNGRYRRFSTREAARIQSFPDTFKLDVVSQIRQYKAIGNAVPPVMMWHITKALQKVLVVHQLDFLLTLEQYPDNIVTHAVGEVHEFKKNKLQFDETKNVLISYVKSDNMEQYLDRSAKIYYTGKKFPSTVALNKLYYFMPYFKGKGIRDLYLIKIARVGTRKEGQSDNDPNELRLVFEIEFMGSLFEDYHPVKLEIWRTFTDTTMKELLSITNKK